MSCDAEVIEVTNEQCQVQDMWQHRKDKRVMIRYTDPSIRGNLTSTAVRDTIRR